MLPPLKPNAPSPEDIEAQIRGHVAFENMVVAVLTGAFSGGVMILVVNLIRLILTDFSFMALVTIALETIFVAIVIFLTGFFTSVAIGAPLFRLLEKRKHRSFWPYLLVAMAAAIIAFLFKVGGLPTRADLSLQTLLTIFAPAIIVALTFARLMAPHWRAAEKAERDADAGPVFLRLH